MYLAFFNFEHSSLKKLEVLQELKDSSNWK